MSDQTVISAFTTEHVSRITGLSPRQLSHWDRLGFFRPSLFGSDTPARTFRVYSFQDVVGLRVIAVLMKDHGVSLRHLKKVAEKLSEKSSAPWSSLRLTVSKGEVGLINPLSNQGEGVLSGQYIMIPLIDQIEHVEREASRLSKRTKEQVGSSERHRNVVHNVRVFSGTRVPVGAVERFLATGYSVDAIRDEYPSLERADIEMVQSELNNSAAA